MIKSFGNRSTARFFEEGKNKFSGMDAQMAVDRQRLLNRAAQVEELYAVGKLRLHKLSGNLSDFWSIDINGPWRLIFIFRDGNAYEVTIYDPH